MKNKQAIESNIQQEVKVEKCCYYCYISSKVYGSTAVRTTATTGTANCIDDERRSFDDVASTFFNIPFVLLVPMLVLFPMALTTNDSALPMESDNERVVVALAQMQVHIMLRHRHCHNIRINSDININALLRVKR
jgi:hypothetical protein